MGHLHASNACRFSCCHWARHLSQFASHQHSSVSTPVCIEQFRIHVSAQAVQLDSFQSPYAFSKNQLLSSQAFLLQIYYRNSVTAYVSVRPKGLRPTAATIVTEHRLVPKSFSEQLPTFLVHRRPRRCPVICKHSCASFCRPSWTILTFTIMYLQSHNWCLTKQVSFRSFTLDLILARPDSSIFHLNSRCRWSCPTNGGVCPGSVPSGKQNVEIDLL